MNGSIKKISLTAAYLSDALIDYQDLNTDVIVQFQNGDEYVATFFSVKNLERIIQEHKKSSDYLSEEYYRILNAVLVDDLSTTRLMSVIEHMIIEGDFQLVFKKV